MTEITDDYRMDGHSGAIRCSVIRGEPEQTTDMRLFEVPKLWRIIHDPDNGYPKGALFSWYDTRIGACGFLPGTRFENMRTGQVVEIIATRKGRNYTRRVK